MQNLVRKEKVKHTNKDKQPKIEKDSYEVFSRKGNRKMIPFASFPITRKEEDDNHRNPCFT